jgi:hypothetical protein
MTWWQQIPLERVFFLAFAAGVLWSEVRRIRASLKSQGERLGALTDRVAKLEGRSDGR